MSETKFQCIGFDDEKQRIQILDGDIGFVDYKDIFKVSILNEKAKYHGKKPHFTALVPHGPLPQGLFEDPYLYVALKIELKDSGILALYISKEKTMKNTDQYIKDRKEADKIKKKIDQKIML